MSFAALEARVNASVLKHLANATVIIAGETCPGIFKTPSQIAGPSLGHTDGRPQLTIASSFVPDEPVDRPIVVNGIPYAVGTCDPDGTGLSVMFLDRTQ